MKKAVQKSWFRRFESLALGLFLAGLTGFQPRPTGETGTVKIAINLHFSGKSVELKNRIYHSPTGDSLRFDLVKFYLSAIRLNGQNVVFEERNSFHLIDAEENGSQIIELTNVPVGRYDSISFNIGTDSLTNVAAPILSGDLEPVFGMYWAWNSGYVNFKIEGRSKSCSTLRDEFAFHVGGFLAPFQTVRRAGFSMKPVEVAASDVENIELNADLAHFFSKIYLASDHNVMTPSATAARMADQFKTIFSLTEK